MSTTLLSLFLFFFLLLHFSAAAIDGGVSSSTFHLHRLRRHLPSATIDSFEHFAELAKSSLRRAHHLKNPDKMKKKKQYSPAVEEPLFAHSYGGYSMTLAFGTPPQLLSVILDTGSHLTWISCTRNYACRDCSSPSNPSSVFPVFLPRNSTSARLLGCRNPKCSYFHSPSRISSCVNCNTSNTSSQTCSPLCPPYVIIYGSGSTAGLLLSDTLDLPGWKVANFTFGCSLVSIHQPSGGIAGFGRGPGSLPAQLNLNQFSYCMISRRFDDNATESGDVVLGGSPADSAGMQSTPFATNPTAKNNNSAFSVYYYLTLKKITVDGKKVKMVSSSKLSTGADGNGGVIIDSGTTFTYMEPAVLEPLEKAMVAAVAGKLNRSAIAEAGTGLRPCFALPSGETELKLPGLALHFKGGAEMRLPVENYFAFVGHSALCLTIVSDAGNGESSATGPAVILGSFQQQNYKIVYDLEKERLRFRQQSCGGS